MNKHDDSMDDRYDSLGFWIFTLSFAGVSLFFVLLIVFRSEFFVDTQKVSQDKSVKLTQKAPSVESVNGDKSASDEDAALASDEDAVVQKKAAFVPALVKKPWKNSADLAQHGAQVYKASCAMCHGDAGKGDGIAGAAMRPSPRNIVEGKWTKGGKPSQLYITLTEGVAGTSMAAFGHLSSVDRWALVHFMRSITKNKPAESEASLKKFYNSYGNK